jgi:gliding motility-associated-like protein
MKLIFNCVVFLFTSFLLFSQEATNQCFNAGMLCPQETTSVSNIGATITFCPSCEDDFSLCFTPLNTVWVRFQTNSMGGEASLTGSNIVFNPGINNMNNSFNLAIFQASIPCDASSYTEMACLIDQSTNFNMDIPLLLPNTIYYLVLSGTQNNGATQASEVTLNLRISGDAVNRPAESLPFGASETTFCRGKAVYLNTDTTFCPGGNQTNWYKNNQFWLTTPINQIVVDDIEHNDEIYAESVCYTFCPQTVESNRITFNVLDFEINAGEDQEIFHGESVILTGTTSGVNYYWEPALWLNDPLVLEPVATPGETTTFFFTASNGICEKTDEVTVSVSEELKIPSVFSPNGDGINDTWEIPGTEKFPNIRIEVFDRWGQIVFESVSYNETKYWNGTHRGKTLATSTYYYVINFNDANVGEKTIKGAVSIVR